MSRCTSHLWSSCFTGFSASLATLQLLSSNPALFWTQRPRLDTPSQGQIQSDALTQHKGRQPLWKYRERTQHCSVECGTGEEMKRAGEKIQEGERNGDPADGEGKRQWKQCCSEASFPVCLCMKASSHVRTASEKTTFFIPCRKVATQIDPTIKISSLAIQSLKWLSRILQVLGSGLLSCV